LRTKESRLGSLRLELSGGAELIDGLIEESEGVAERVRQVVGRIDEGGRAWA